jgi:Uma2 family endonuclease
MGEVVDKTRTSKNGDPPWEIAELFPAQGTWSEEDYLRLTDETNRMVEFIDGRVAVLEMPTREHQRAIRVILQALEAWIAATRRGVVVQAPFRVRLGAQCTREPDVSFLLSDADSRNGNRLWTGADLVVEVVSEGAADRNRYLVEKRADYAAAGIAEYWIVDPQDARVTVLVLVGTEYQEHSTAGIEGKVTSKLLAGLTLDVAKVLSAYGGEKR